SVDLSVSSSFPLFFFHPSRPPRDLPSFPTRRSSDLCPFAPLRRGDRRRPRVGPVSEPARHPRRTRLVQVAIVAAIVAAFVVLNRSEEHTSELQSRSDLVCRLLLEKKKKKN